MEDRVKTNDIEGVELREVRYEGVAGALLWRFGRHETESGRQGDAIEVENDLDWGWLRMLAARDNDDFMDMVNVIFDAFSEGNTSDPPYGGISINYGPDASYIGWEWGDTFIAVYPGGRVRVGTVGV